MTRLLPSKKSCKQRGSFFSFFFIFIYFLFLLNSCFKPAGEIGDVIQPEQTKLKVYYSDTATVYAYSIKEDSVRSDELTRNQLGSIVDPVFGATNASFYSQVVLSSLSQDFGPNPVLDSIFLYLYYDGFYGDTTTEQKVRVFELQDSIAIENVYYSNLNKEVKPVDYADYSFIPKPNDSIIVGSDTLPPMLRINLSANPALGNYLLNASTEDLASNEAFQQYFKGLYVTADPVSSNGSILFFNLLATYSRLIIHYKNDDEDSLYYNFLITGSCARINKYTHDFSFGNNDFRQQVLNGDTALGKQQYYVQGLAGVKSVIRFPYLKEWNKLGNVAINEAKLILSGNENPPYNGVPAQVVVVQINEDGSYHVMNDNLQYGSYFGGTYKSSVNQYQFRITDYVQSIISNPEVPDYGLYLFVYGSSIQPQRFIFTGNEPASDTVSRLRLEIIYTDL